MTDSLEQRRSRFSTLSTRLSYLDDDEMLALLGPSAGQGFWGTHQSAGIGEWNAFV